MRALLIGNDPVLADELMSLLKKEGFFSDPVGYGDDISDYLQEEIYDILIIVSAYQVDLSEDLIRLLRRSKVDLPILLLSSLHEVRAAVTGLDAGADDYIRLPFEDEEFLARVKALTRRKGVWTGGKTEIGNTVIDFSRRCLICGGKKLSLTEKEYEIARILFSSFDQIVPKDKLSARVWGLDSENEYNQVEVYISFLRRKLREAGSSLEIKTARGRGYRLTGKKYTGL